jgi:hypothetical protein
MGRFEVLDTMARSVFDIDSLSTPAAPPKIAKSVKVPEAFGLGDPNAETYHPAGILCGATSTRSMAEIPLPPMPCCPDPAARTERYQPCEGDTLPPDCDSILDLFMGGCDIYPMMMEMPGGGPPRIPDGGWPEGGFDRPEGGFDRPEGGMPDFEFECGSRGFGEFYISMVYATKPDVDSDGDGKKDAYSIVIGYEGNRAKITGVEKE